MFLIRTISASRRVLFQLQLCLSFCLFIITVFNEIGHCRGQYAENLPNSGLCESKKDATCSHQVAQMNLSHDACAMLYLNSSSHSCSDEGFFGDVDIGYKYSDMLLLTYLFRQSIHEVPAFNITFSSIKWTEMRMRFKQIGLENTSICRKFRVTDIPQDFSFYFDCLWAHDYDTEKYLFQYQVVTENDDVFLYKYFFFVPDRKRIDEETTELEEWEIFSVVDMTDKVSRLVLTAQAAPAHFNVTGYRIRLICRLWNTTRVVLEKILPPPLEPYLKFSYDTKSRPGIYHFIVSLVHPICDERECYESATPSIEIAALPPRKMLIMMVGAVILIPLLIMGYFLWRRRCNINVPSIENIGPPKFLIIYNPVSMEHVNNMIEVSKYFNKVCHLQAMIDVIGIPASDHKDPMRWYNDAFTDADFVGIFASPKVPPGSKEEVHKSYVLYQNAESIAHRQLRQRLCSPGAKCKFFGVALPDCCWETLPVEAQALKRYTLPRDLDPLLVLIGVVPQCDHGEGFTEALSYVKQSETTNVPTKPEFTLDLSNGGVLVNNSGGHCSCGSSPTPTPVTCCPDLTGSDPDLTSQPATSCMATPHNSSDDEVSLLGD